MKLVIFASVILAVSCAPPAAKEINKEVIPIVRLENEGVNSDGSYSWNFETGNNIAAHEEGTVKKGEKPDEAELEVVGGYEYTNEDGTKVQISYIANKDGFQPQGDVLPTPPPIPPAIARLLEYIKAHPSEEDQKQ
ncbi:endocuticle structural glycoprotein ABD-4-like [Diorhabda carinulata]|uniref:endocuticle structural glycoprotein ABD-4-like n=1 Tax=Diorhabda carinulata TaxID=1163345 RepID=UPI0025A121F0|nr:endocuticle structural glycoprotein ABD-4-like [Diorhabda carinulata]